MIKSRRGIHPNSNLITVRGITLSMRGWSDKLEVNHSCVSDWIKRVGLAETIRRIEFCLDCPDKSQWTFHRFQNKLPLEVDGVNKSISGWSKEIGISREALLNRRTILGEDNLKQFIRNKLNGFDTAYRGANKVRDKKPENWDELYEKYKNRELKAKEVLKLSGLSLGTFCYYVNLEKISKDKLALSDDDLNEFIKMYLERYKRSYIKNKFNLSDYRYTKILRYLEQQGILERY